MMQAPPQRTDGFIALQIHVDALKNLLSSKALYLEDIHCSDNNSKHLLKQLLMLSVMPDKQA